MKYIGDKILNYQIEGIIYKLQPMITSKYNEKIYLYVQIRIRKAILDLSVIVAELTSVGF